MDITAILLAIIALISNVITWFLSKRKYKAEVNSNEIQNLKDSLEFYQRIVRDNDKQLRFYIKLAEDNRVEVYRLKGIVATLLNNSCLDGTCGKRKYYTEEDIRHILGGELPEKQEENETKS